MKSSRDTGDKKYEGIERRDFLRYISRGLAGLAIASSVGLGYAPSAYADTVYFGKVKDAKTSAYVVYSDISAKSKYQPGKDDSDRAKKIATRDTNIRTSITAVAVAGSYDVIVEKGDPVISGYKDVNKEVIETLKAIEKGQ